MKKVFKGRWGGVAAGVVAGVIFLGIGNAAFAQTAPPLPQGVQDVVKMSQAGLTEDVIMAQVRNAGATYTLSADQIIYLSKVGVPQPVIRALISGSASSAPAAPVATAPVPTTTPPPAPTTTPVAPDAGVPPPPSGDVVPGAPGADEPPPTYDSFHNQLAPYGTWMQLPGYGWVWRPTVASFGIHWHPYGNGGHWTYTDTGWYWDSDYPWGNIVFHYGRWFRDSMGWAWVPGYTWSPGWVTWRQSEGYIGWAPLPPGAVFRAGVGLEFDGRVGVDLDFGLPFGAFVFVGYDHFWDHDLHAFFVPHDRAEWMFRHSVVYNGFRFDHGRFIIDGPGRDRIGLWTHHDVVRFGFGGHGYDRGHFDDRRGFHDDRDRRFDHH